MNTKKKTKTEVIGFRVSAALKQTLEARAQQSGETLTAYLSEIVGQTQLKKEPLTSEQLEERLDISPLSLTMSYLDNIDLSDRRAVHVAAQKLATLDPDGVKWYPKVLPDGWLWYPDVKQPSDYKTNLKQLHALLDTGKVEPDEPTPPYYNYPERASMSADCLQLPLART